MELIIRGSFFRDWDNIVSRELSKAIEGKKDEVKAARNISHISYLKKLRISQHKIYWILCVIRKPMDRIEFVRLKPESYFKKNL